MNKLGFTEKQIGHMTFGKFMRLYNAYKRFNDMERKMDSKRLLYEDLEREVSIDDVIPK